MHWSGVGIIISVRKFGEHAATVKLFTPEHGLYAGMARGVLGKSQRGIYQLGNMVQVRWQARLAEHMGTVACEVTKPVAALVMESSFKLALLTSLCSLLESALPERHPYPKLYEMVAHFLHGLIDESEESTLISEYVWLEKELLSAVGFGLDFSCCAATGGQDELVYVSPRTGRAVSREPGAPYHDKMLPLPPFLLKNDGYLPISAQALLDGIVLTRYFLESRVYAPHGKKLPTPRVQLEQTIRNIYIKHGKAV